MLRRPRFNLVGIPQHVIQRGNNREPCFYAEEDYKKPGQRVIASNIIAIEYYRYFLSYPIFTMNFY